MRAFKTGILIALAMAFIGGAIMQPLAKQNLVSANHCLHNELTVNTDTTLVSCINIEDDSSWFSWLTGDSRSAQFHYLDLLELLTRSDDTKKPSLNPLFN